MTVRFVLTALPILLVCLYLLFHNAVDIPLTLLPGRVWQVPLVFVILASALLGALGTGLSDLPSHLIKGWRRRRERRAARRRQQAETFYQAARQAVASGDAHSARGDFRRALRKNPQHPNALLEYGNLQRNLGKLDAAFDLHRKALHTSGSELGTLESLADDFLSAGRPDALQALWDRARRAGRGEEIPLQRLRDHYVFKKEWNAAVNIQETLLQTPGYARKEEGRHLLACLLYEAGSEVLDSGQTEAGISLFQRSLRNKADFVPAHVALGDAFRQAGDAKKALGEWRVGFERTPALVFLDRMISMLSHGVSDKVVVQTLRKALRRHPSDDRIILALAETHMHAGRAADALEELTRLSESARGTLPARTLRARAHLELGHWDDARSELSPHSQNGESVLGDFRERPGFQCSACEEILESWTPRCPVCGRWETVDARG